MSVEGTLLQWFLLCLLSLKMFRIFGFVLSVPSYHTLIVFIKFFAHLGGRDFDIHNDGGEGSFPKLGWVVDGVGIQNHQL